MLAHLYFTMSFYIKDIDKNFFLKKINKNLSFTHSISTATNFTFESNNKGTYIKSGKKYLTVKNNLLVFENKPQSWFVTFNSSNNHHLIINNKMVLNEDGYKLKGICKNKGFRFFKKDRIDRLIGKAIDRIVKGINLDKDINLFFVNKHHKKGHRHIHRKRFIF